MIGHNKIHVIKRHVIKFTILGYRREPNRKLCSLLFHIADSLLDFDRKDILTTTTVIVQQNILPIVTLLKKS